MLPQRCLYGHDIAHARDKIIAMITLVLLGVDGYALLISIIFCWRRDMRRFAAAMRRLIAPRCQAASLYVSNVDDDARFASSRAVAHFAAGLLRLFLCYLFSYGRRRMAGYYACYRAWLAIKLGAARRWARSDKISKARRRRALPAARWFAYRWLLRGFFAIAAGRRYSLPMPLRLSTRRPFRLMLTYTPFHSESTLDAGNTGLSPSWRYATSRRLHAPHRRDRYTEEYKSARPPCENAATMSTSAMLTILASAAPLMPRFASARFLYYALILFRLRKIMTRPRLYRGAACLYTPSSWYTLWWWRMLRCYDAAGEAISTYVAWWAAVDCSAADWAKFHRRASDMMIFTCWLLSDDYGGHTCFIFAETEFTTSPLRPHMLTA